MQPSSSLVSTNPDLRNDFDYDLTNRRKLLIEPPAGSVTDLHDEHSYLETEAQFDGHPGDGAPLLRGLPESTTDLVFPDSTTASSAPGRTGEPWSEMGSLGRSVPRLRSSWDRLLWAR